MLMKLLIVQALVRSICAHDLRFAPFAKDVILLLGCFCHLIFGGILLVLKCDVTARIT